MSKTQAAKQQKPQAASQGQQFPTCINKKEARLVCLNPGCNEHGFFCTGCENDQCQVVHHHGSKLSSVSFKQYLKKVLRDKMIDESLEQALNKYAECLEKLKKDVEEFVQKQLNQLQQIKRKAAQIGQEEQKIIQRLRKKEYTGLKGSQLDKLWQRMAEFDKQGKNKQTIQFLSIKQEQIKQISDNFQKVNKMQLQDFIEEDNQKEVEIKKQKIEQKPSTKQPQKDKYLNKPKKQETVQPNNTNSANKNVKKK